VRRGTVGWEPSSQLPLWGVCGLVAEPPSAPDVQPWGERCKHKRFHPRVGWYADRDDASYIASLITIQAVDNELWLQRWRLPRRRSTRIFCWLKAKQVNKVSGFSEPHLSLFCALYIPYTIFSCEIDRLLSWANFTITTASTWPYLPTHYSP